MSRDPRAEPGPLEARLQVKFDSIQRRLGWLKGEEGVGPPQLTDFRDLGRCYSEALSISYSLGADPDELRGFVAPAVDWYIKHQSEYRREYPDTSWREVPIAVIDAARLLSVVILLGTAEQRARIGEAVKLRGSDTALEFLAGMHGDSLDGVEVVLSQPRPYGRLVKVVQAEPERRPQLMAEFVKHWYNECRKAYWWGEHLRGPKYGKPVSYDGYWCFEAAAVTKLLGIDDTLYRDNEYYPQDLLPARD